MTGLGVSTSQVKVTFSLDTATRCRFELYECLLVTVPLQRSCVFSEVCFLSVNKITKKSYG